ncbi:hypothetical protein [Oceaniferula spumae]|uniref:hypothetical protein n=1 Tax=Oceaniferula spumae TaxID=2979115 RepID=UPI003F4EF6E9
MADNEKAALNVESRHGDLGTPNAPKRRRRRRSRKPEPKKSVAPLVLGGGVIMLLVCSLAFYKFYLKERLFSAGKQGKVSATQPLQVQETPAYVINFVQAPAQDESRKVAELFTNAVESDKRLKWARNPDLVKPRLHEYAVQAVNAVPDRLVAVGSAKNSEFGFQCFMAYFTTGSPRPICVVATEDGPKVDWDCYARYGTASWELLLNNSVKSAEMRVLAVASDYYNYEFRDESKWQCYRIMSPDLDEEIYGYVARDSAAAGVLSKITIWNKSSPMRVILKLTSGPDSLKRRQLRIKNAIAIGWVKGDLSAETTDSSPTVHEFEKELKTP